MTFRTALLAATLLGASAFSAGASILTFEFSQSGYTNGGTFSGMLTAVDENMDGILQSGNGEFKTFTASFTGNSVLGDLSFDNVVLNNVRIDLATNRLGMTVSQRQAPPRALLVYSERQIFGGGLDYNGTILIQTATGSRDRQNSNSQMTLTRVTTPPPNIPLPASIWLLGFGAVGLGLLRRRNA